MMEKKSATKSSTSHYTTNLDALLVAGIFAKKRFLTVVHILVRFIILVSGGVQIGLYSFVSDENFNLLDSIESIHWVILYFVVGFWTIDMLYYSKTFLLVHDAIKKGIYEYSDGLMEVQSRIRDKANDNANKSNFILNCMYTCGLVASFFKGTFFASSEEWRPMYPGWWPFEINTFTRLMIAYAFDVTVATNLVLVGSAFFKTYVVIGCHILGQLEILTISIEDTFSKNDVTDEYLLKRIKSLVEHHNAISELFENYHKMFTYSLLWAAFCQELLLCTLAYLLTDPNCTIGLIASFVCVLTSELTITLIGCQLGENIIDKSNKVLDTIYNVNWYERSPKVRSDLLMIMIRCKRPLKVNAGGLIVYCREGFKDIIQASYTYFNVLNASRI